MKCCETVQFTVHCSADYCIESFFSLVDISMTRPSPGTPYEYFHVGTHGTIIKELLLTTRKLMALKSRKKKSLYFFLIFLSKKGSWVFIRSRAFLSYSRSFYKIDYYFVTSQINHLLSVKKRLSSYHFQQAQEVLQKSIANCYYQFYLLLKPTPLVTQWTIVKNLNWKISAFKLLRSFSKRKVLTTTNFQELLSMFWLQCSCFLTFFLPIWGHIFVYFRFEF